MSTQTPRLRPASSVSADLADLEAHIGHELAELARQTALLSPWEAREGGPDAWAWAPGLLGPRASLRGA